MRFRVYPTDLQDIDTSDLYHSYMIFKGTDLLIPLINMGISEHVLNPNVPLQYIDRSYLFFRSACSIRINKMARVITEGIVPGINMCYLDSHNLHTKVHDGIEIEYASAYLILLDDSIIRNDVFYPFDGSFYKANISKEAISAFLDPNYIAFIDEIMENA